VNGQSTNSPTIGEDTIELELTPEQWLELARAAEVAEPVAAAQISAVTAPDRSSREFSPPQPLFKAGPPNRFRRWPIARMAGAIIAYVAFAWWSASQLAGQPHPPATVAARPPTVVIPRPALMTGIAIPVVRIVNPFDRTEVFEFPAGTSAVEGHEKVAQILMQRARDRQSQWEHIKPVVKVRTASLYPSP
jgi:hypothetical protein